MNKRNWILLIIAVILAIVAIWYGAKKASASVIYPTPTPMCVHAEGECQINESGHQCCGGLVCGEFNEHSGNGKCITEPTPTPTPTPTKTPTPTPTATPCYHWEDEKWVACSTPTPTPSPSPSPTATPSATPVPTEPPSQPLTPAGAPQLPACTAPVWAPTLRFVGRVGNTVSFQWTQIDPNLHDYIVWYGTSPTNMPWNVKVHGESVDLHDVPAGSIFAKVAGDSSDCIGPFSLVVDP